MGRTKRKLELLSNEKERLRTFERRSKGLKKQVHELKTLCDTEVCLIVDSATKGELQIWPPDRDQINKLITCYKNQPTHDISTKSNLSTFFEARNQKLETEIMELKKKDNNNMYPTWDHGYNMLSREQLGEFGGLLGQKLQFLKNRMESMRNSSYISSFQNSESLRFGEYFQNTMATQNGLYFSSPVSFTEPEIGNSFGSLSTQNDPCYTQLRDLSSSNLMDWPNCNNFDNFGTQNDELFGESLSANSDEFLIF